LISLSNHLDAVINTEENHYLLNLTKSI